MSRGGTEVWPRLTFLTKWNYYVGRSLFGDLIKSEGPIRKAKHPFSVGHGGGWAQDGSREGTGAAGLAHFGDAWAVVLLSPSRRMPRRQRSMFYPKCFGESLAQSRRSIKMPHINDTLASLLCSWTRGGCR